MIELDIEEIDRLYRLAIGDKNGHGVCDKAAALRLISVHLTRAIAAVRERDEAIARLGGTVPENAERAADACPDCDEGELVVAECERCNGDVYGPCKTCKGTGKRVAASGTP